MLYDSVPLCALKGRAWSRIDQGPPSFRMRWRLWRRDPDVIKSLDVIDDVTNRGVIGIFLQGPHWISTP